MKINKNSWHYKLVSFRTRYYNVPSDVCGYVRSVLLRMIGIFLALFSVVSVVYFLISPPIEDTASVVEIVSYTVGGLMCIVAGLAVGLCAMVAAAFVVIVVVISPFIFIGEYINKDSSPFVQYVKDKHNKICTMLEFIDED